MTSLRLDKQAAVISLYPVLQQVVLPKTIISEKKLEKQTVVFFIIGLISFVAVVFSLDEFTVVSNQG